MIEHFLEHFIVTALVIYGVHASTREGRILYPVVWGLYAFYRRLKARKRGTNNIPIIPSTRYIYLTKVLFDCTPCMASLYGTISFFMIEDNIGIQYLPIWIFALCGFNYILSRFINN